MRVIVGGMIVGVFSLSAAADKGAAKRALRDRGSYISVPVQVDPVIDGTLTVTAADVGGAAPAKGKGAVMSADDVSARSREEDKARSAEKSACMARVRAMPNKGPDDRAARKTAQDKCSDDEKAAKAASKERYESGMTAARVAGDDAKSDNARVIGAIFDEAVRRKRAEGDALLKHRALQQFYWLRSAGGYPLLYWADQQEPLTELGKLGYYAACAEQSVPFFAACQVGAADADAKRARAELAGLGLEGFLKAKYETEIEQAAKLVAGIKARKSELERDDKAYKAMFSAADKGYAAGERELSGNADLVKLLGDVAGKRFAGEDRTSAYKGCWEKAKPHFAAVLKTAVIAHGKRTKDQLGSLEPLNLLGTTRGTLAALAIYHCVAGLGEAQGLYGAIDSIISGMVVRGPRTAAFAASFTSLGELEFDRKTTKDAFIFDVTGKSGGKSMPTAARGGEERAEAFRKLSPAKLEAAGQHFACMIRIFGEKTIGQGGQDDFGTRDRERTETSAAASEMVKRWSAQVVPMAYEDCADAAGRLYSGFPAEAPYKRDIEEGVVAKVSGTTLHFKKFVHMSTDCADGYYTNRPIRINSDGTIDYEYKCRRYETKKCVHDATSVGIDPFLAKDIKPGMHVYVEFGLPTVIRSGTDKPVIGMMGVVF